MKIKKIEFKIKSKIDPLKTKFYSHVKSSFLKDISVQLLLLPVVSLLAASWIFSIYYFKSESYLVPLRYSSFLGFFQLGRWYQSYELPAFYTLVIILNIILGNIIYKKDKFLAYIIVASNIFISLVVLAIIVNFGKAIN